MPNTTVLALSAFVAASSLVLLLAFLLRGRPGRLELRLESLAARGEDGAPAKDVVSQMAKVLPKIGQPLLPETQEERTRLQARLIHAGLYRRQDLSIFLGVKMLLMFVPVFLGLVAAVWGIVPIFYGVLFGLALGVGGSLATSIWLDQKKAHRQTAFRRSLPDALDVLVICLEGGLSLSAAFRRVASELRTAHPLLAAELNILQREMQLGLSAGEALRQFADRADMEELRTLASVLLQSERLGAGMANALRVHGDSLRFKRMSVAEEKAAQAGVKILFPTILLIFPGLFIVILGPAAIRVVETISQMKPAP